MKSRRHQGWLDSRWPLTSVHRSPPVTVTVRVAVEEPPDHQRSCTERSSCEFRRRPDHRMPFPDEAVSPFALTVNVPPFEPVIGPETSPTTPLTARHSQCVIVRIGVVRQHIAGRVRILGYRRDISHRRRSGIRHYPCECLRCRGAVGSVAVTVTV